MGSRRGSSGRTENLVATVLDNLENRKQTKLSARKGGPVDEMIQKGSPTAKWQKRIYKGNYSLVKGESVINFSGAINAAGRTGTKVEAITLFVSSSLSGTGDGAYQSIFIDKIGVSGSQFGNYNSTAGKIIDQYFYTSSIDISGSGYGQFISSSGDKILAFPGRAGTSTYDHSGTMNTPSSPIPGGVFTASADVTVTLSHAPAHTGSNGKIYLFVYMNKYWAAY